ncbi:hypothetical protein NC651_011742 [Populus alba x Populus x berolinensis]|nr:hypothetical protein NC651_011742 [Populus alba x Populus x berolinensis]
MCMDCSTVLATRALVVSSSLSGCGLH